jgi:hypothetical protein
VHKHPGRVQCGERGHTGHVGQAGQLGVGPDAISAWQVARWPVRFRVRRPVSGTAVTSVTASQPRQGPRGQSRRGSACA